MARIAEGANSATILSTFKGAFVQKVSADTPNAVSRENKLGNVVHELRFQGLTGFIVKAEYVKRENDNITYRNVNIHLQDGEDVDIISLSLTGTPALVFFQTMESIDFTKEVELRIWTDDKDKTAFAVKQGDEFIKWNYPKANPNGKPDWEKQEDELGEVKWSRAKELKFFLDILEKTVAPKIGNADPHAITPSEEAPQFEGAMVGSAQPAAIATTATASEDDDGLPF